ncbi:MAG TPA: hypothetical protein VH796_05465 [Nitrososphaeraceae archaeon]
MPAIFSTLYDDLVRNLRLNENSLKSILARNPSSAYAKINEIAHFVGSRYFIEVRLQFPQHEKIFETESYGTENLGLIVNKFRKTFPIPREQVKLQACDMLDTVRVQDAYMYEGKEGVRVITKNGRLEVLPGSVHLWCKVDDNVKSYVDWLMDMVYVQDLKK